MDLVSKATNATAKIFDLESLLVSGFFVPSRSRFLGWLRGCGGWLGGFVGRGGWGGCSGWLAFVDFSSPICDLGGWR